MPSQSELLPDYIVSVDLGASIWPLPEEAEPMEHFVTDGVLQIWSWSAVRQAEGISNQHDTSATWLCEYFEDINGHVAF